MTKKTKRKHADDLRAVGKLAVTATKVVTDVVEDMHRTIASGPAVLGRPLAGPARLLTRIAYWPVKSVTQVVGLGLDAALAKLGPLLGDSAPGPQREAGVAVLNGVLGDHLHETRNPLAIEMSFRRDGVSGRFTQAQVGRAFRAAVGRSFAAVAAQARAETIRKAS